MHGWILVPTLICLRLVISYLLLKNDRDLKYVAQKKCFQKRMDIKKELEILANKINNNSYGKYLLNIINNT